MFHLWVTQAHSKLMKPQMGAILRNRKKNQSHDTDVISPNITVTSSMKLFMVDQLVVLILRDYFSIFCAAEKRLAVDLVLNRLTYTLTDMIRTPRTIAEIAPNTSFFRFSTEH